MASGAEPGGPNQLVVRNPSGRLCEAGHYLTEDCYMGQARGCCPCPPGTFLSHPNREASCGLCTPCRKDQEMVRDCTPTRDRQCRCKPGEYYCDSEYCSERCFPCTSCPGAALQACTATRDTVCAPGAPAQPGPADGSFAVVSVVVLVIIAITCAIAWWCSGAASVEPGSQGHTQTTAPENGPPAPNTETTLMLQEEADTLPPAARGPDPPGTLSRPRGRNGAAGGGGGRRPGSPRDGSPTSCCRPPRSPGLEAPAGLWPPEQVPESSGPFISSPETRGADAPVPTTGSRLLPEDHLDVLSELLILPQRPCDHRGRSEIKTFPPVDVAQRLARRVARKGWNMYIWSRAQTWIAGSPPKPPIRAPV